MIKTKTRVGDDLTGGLLVPLAAFLPRSRANGPGVRSVLWVQGCPFRCPGCFNPEFLEFSGGQPTDVETVVNWILARDDTEGVTFSGGEPFAHAEVLAAVAQQVQRAGKSVVVFTGYEKNELLVSQDVSKQRLLESADLLIAGPYRTDMPSREAWLSSTNQELVFLTDRYRQQDADTVPQRIEFRIASNGTTTVTGFPHRRTATTRQFPHPERVSSQSPGSLRAPWGDNNETIPAP